MAINLKVKSKELQEDWEKIILALMASLALFLFLTFIINTFFSDESQQEMNVSGSPHRSIFEENSFAFLYGVPIIEEEETPFNLKKPFRKPKIRKPPPKEVKHIPKPNPKPKPEKQGHVIHYNGWITLDSGEKIAFVKIHDFKTGNLLKSDSIEIGNTIFDYKILNIDDEKMILEEPNGEEKEIPIHKNITIMIK